MKDLTKDKKCAISKEITKTQADFLEFCKEFGWGKLEVQIRDGEPVSSKEIERTHRHDFNN